MKFDLLKKIKPDHVIRLDPKNYYVKWVSPDVSEILFIRKVNLNVPLDEIITGVNDQQYFTSEFMANLHIFVQTKKENIALIILNSGYIKNKQTRGLLVYLVRLNCDDENNLELEFFNLISLSNLVTDLFSHNIWHKFKNAIVSNRHNFISQQLWLAYRSILPLFLLTNTSEVNMQAKPKYELGDLLFYFNSYTKNKLISPSSGRNILTECLARSEDKLSESVRVNTKNQQNLILGSSIVKNQFIILN